jgi:hypothetical protein
MNLQLTRRTTDTGWHTKSITNAHTMGGIDREGTDVNPNFMTDAEHSVLRPFGPHLIEQSSNSPAQAVTRSGVTTIRPYTATVAITVPATRVRLSRARPDSSTAGVLLSD